MGTIFDVLRLMLRHHPGLTHDEKQEGLKAIDEADPAVETPQEETSGD